MYVTLLIAYQLFMATGVLAEAPQVNPIPVTILNLPVATQAPLLDVILGGNLVQAFYAVFPSGAPDLFTLASQFFNTSGGIFDISSLVGGVLGGFLLSILVAILFIRLFFLFLGAYVQIILQVIFGPLYILSDVVPGSNNIGGWIKNIVSNLAVFVIAGILFMLTIFFNTQADNVGQSLWVPPYTMIGSSVSSISALFSLGILMMLPNIVGQFKQSIKSAGGPGIGGAFSLGPVAGVATWGYHLLQSRQYHQGQKRLEERLGQPERPQGIGSAVNQGKSE
jgi:hypothetical protein